MRDKGIYSATKCLPRMSWSPSNLYNLYNRSLGPKSLDTNFDKTSQTLFQQRWKSKRMARAYHGDYISEKIFRRWFLPSQLPIIRPSKSNNKNHVEGLAKWSKISNNNKVKNDSDNDKSIPVGSLMFAELERRLDHLVFRACLASSIYEARRFITQGHVKLNGYRHVDPNTRLDPGDLVSVNPNQVTTLNQLRNSTSVADNESKNESNEESETENVEENANEDNEKNHKIDTHAIDKVLPFNLPPYAAPHIFIPPYIEPSFATCSFVYVRHPTARPGYSEIPTPYAADGDVMRYAREWYIGRSIRARNLGSGPWGGPRRPSGVKRGKGEERRG